ncbi:hypothetical protein [Sphingomonas parapaucimobilis]|uniref:hypothetical protein n=1 Tax=Sphingomonas parapaucimobilis TaxID=28213 RepID=UPI00321AF17A
MRSTPPSTGVTTSPFRSTSTWTSITTHRLPVIRYSPVITAPSAVVASTPTQP